MPIGLMRRLVGAELHVGDVRGAAGDPRRVVLGHGQAAPCGAPSSVPRALSLHEMRSSVLCLLNRIRVHYKLHPLAYNRALRTSASAHSVSMVVHGYFAHEGPGGSMDHRISRAGYLAAARAEQANSPLIERVLAVLRHVTRADAA